MSHPAPGLVDTTRRLALAGILAVALPAAAAGQSAAPAATPPAAPAATPAAAAAATPCPEQEALFVRLAAALERRPEDATLHFWRARAWAQCGHGEPAAAALGEVARLGEGFLPVRTAGFERVWDDPAFRRAHAKLEAALPRADGAREAFRIRRRDLVPEGIAWDPATKRLLLGSIATGEVLAVAADGAMQRFAGPFDGRPVVLGVAIDAGRRRAYAVVTNGLGRPEGAAVLDAVVELDADSGAVLRRLPAAGATQLNDVAVAADGTLFVSDSGAGSVWRAAPGAAALAAWLEGSLPGANGVAVAPSGDAIFVGHATGIARIALADGAVTARLANDTGETLAAIDGLYARGGTLIGVQNVTNPGRVVELSLDPTGTRVTAVRTLVSHHHRALDEPTTGAVDGDRFLLLAATGVGRYQPDGTIADAATAPEPVVLEVALGPLPGAPATPSPTP